MAQVLFGNSMWQLIVISDGMSKLILVALLGMSITCWTLFFYKLILLRIKKKQMKEALIAIKNKCTLADLLTLSAQLSKTLPGFLLNNVLAYVRDLLQLKGQEKQSLSMQEWDLVSHHIDQVYVEMVEQEEHFMPVIYSCAGVATLIGLFGTVWGLVHSFIRIAEKQSADIATVAPGIAEALITTLAGLMVAIPAYIMFHYLSVQIRKLEGQLDSFADIASLSLKQVFMHSNEDAEMISLRTKQSSTQVRGEQ